MLKNVRLTKIKEMLLDRQQVSVSTLCSVFNVTDVTIRSDLEELEDEGFLKRVHGGAVLNETVEKQTEYKNQVIGSELEFDKNKDIVGKVASEMVEGRQWIFIGAGVTCFYLAKALLNKSDVNIVTNNLYVAAIMSGKKDANTRLIGGNVIPGRMAVDGAGFLDYMDNLCIAKAFFGVSRINMKNGYMVDTQAEYDIYNKVKEISNETVIIADSKKFGKTGLIRIDPVTAVDAVVTDEQLSDDFKSFLFQMGVKTFFSYDIKESSIRDVGYGGF